MLKRWYADAGYVVLNTSPDLQAYRTDRFEGWVQPAGRDRAGPLLELVAVVLEPEADRVGGRRRRPVDRGGSSRSRSRAPSASRSSRGTSSGAGRWRSASSGRRRADAGMSARFVVGKFLGAFATLAFVLVFNFFLFRVVETNPVATLYRGRNLTDAQRDAAHARVRARRLEARAVRPLRRADAPAQPRPLVRDEPAGDGRDLGGRARRRSRSSVSRRCSRWCSGSWPGSPPAGGGERAATGC